MTARLEAGAGTPTARAAFLRVADRVAALLRSIPDPGRPSALPRWSIGDVGVHLITVFRAFGDSVAGNPDWWSPFIPDEPAFRPRLVATNEAGVRMLAGLGASSDRLADLLADGARDFLAKTEHVRDDAPMPTPWYGPGARRTAGFAAPLLLGEVICHGLDIARAAGRPWPIEPADARIVLGTVIPEMMPTVADPAAIGRADLTYDLRVRGGGRWAITVRDRGVRVAPGPPPFEPDCHVSAAPVAMLLVTYGRMPVLRAVATGRILAYGRRPWVGFRLRSFFVDP
jgi:uncharacterized protein (TIGR03083 family)